MGVGMRRGPHPADNWSQIRSSREVVVFYPACVVGLPAARRRMRDNIFFTLVVGLRKVVV